MTFKELLKTITFDDVWTELNKEYYLKDGAFEAYLRVFNQLKELTPELNHDSFRLAVVKVEDEFELGKFVYDVFGIKPEDKEHYALEMSLWKEWLSDVRTINEHLKNIYAEGELTEEATIRKNRIVQKEGTREVNRDVLFYVKEGSIRRSRIFMPPLFCGGYI